MNSRFRSLLAASILLPLASCDQPPTPAADTAPPPPPPSQDWQKTQEELAAAQDALQRQALEVETRSALMEKQLAEVEQALKERENAELRDSLTALQQQNAALRTQADAARRQSNVITQRLASTTPHVNVLPPVAAPRDHSLFYERLSPYGRWFDVSGYGYCWRPTITTARWRPYVDGCWVWSSLGWTWQSNEPFGWATYHYGRWVNLSRYGWVWVPGDEWAPAWVSWRQSRDYVGWAPLPPDRGPISGVYRDCDSHYNLGPTSYTFINTNQFVQPSYTTVYAPVTRNTTIFQSSVNVTQIVRHDGPAHGHGNGQVFAHQGGPPRAQMERACGMVVPQGDLHALPGTSLQPHQEQGHHEAVPSLAMVELPAARADQPRQRPQIADHIEKPQLVSGFDGVPSQAAAQIRETIAEDKASAVVQQPVIVAASPETSPLAADPMHRHGARPGAPETVRPAIAVADQPGVETVVPPVVMPAVSPTAVVVENAPAAVITPVVPSETPEVNPPLVVKPEMKQPAVAVVPTSEPVATPQQPVVVAPEASQPPMDKAPAEQPVAAVVPASVPESTPQQPVVGTPAVMQPAATDNTIRQQAEAAALAEKMAAEQAASALEIEKTRMQAAAVAQEDQAAQQRMTAEQAAAAEAEKARQLAAAAEQQAQAAAMQQQATQDRAMAEKAAAEQAVIAAEAEKSRMQAAAAQQQEEQAAQQRMAAAEAEKNRQQAEAAAMRQQQEELAAQQRANAERMAVEQAATEAERARQQAEAVAMQRQQEEARRAAEEQQMRQAQQEAERRAQEMAQRQQEEAARQMAERQAQEEARRQQEAAMQRAQEMAQRQAEEQARRAAEEQMRAQQEAAQRAAQEMAQRQAEEAARRAQEEAQRAAAEAARNQPQPQNPGM